MWLGGGRLRQWRGGLPCLPSTLPHTHLPHCLCTFPLPVPVCSVAGGRHVSRLPPFFLLPSNCGSSPAVANPFSTYHACILCCYSVLTMPLLGLLSCLHVFGSGLIMSSVVGGDGDDRQTWKNNSFFLTGNRAEGKKDDV